MWVREMEFSPSLAQRRRRNARVAQHTFRVGAKQLHERRAVFLKRLLVAIFFIAHLVLALAKNTTQAIQEEITSFVHAAAAMPELGENRHVLATMRVAVVLAQFVEQALGHVEAAGAVGSAA